MTNISADAISNQQTGEQYYLVDVSMHGTLYEDNGDEVIILPGMVASIDVLSGKRTILDYFWQPISKTRDTAFENKIFGMKIAENLFHKKVLKMQIVNKIDHLITKLNELKPTLSDDSSNNEKKFNDLLTSSFRN